MNKSQINERITNNEEATITTTLKELCAAWSCTPSEMGFDEDTPSESEVRFSYNHRTQDFAMVINDHLINNVSADDVLVILQEDPMQELISDITNAANLDLLVNAINALADHVDQMDLDSDEKGALYADLNIDWPSLPTWGEEPTKAQYGAYSWDDTRIMWLEDYRATLENTK